MAAPLACVLEAEIARLTKDRDTWRDQCQQATQELADARHEHMEWLSLLEVAAPDPRTVEELVEDRDGDGGPHP